MAVGDRTVQVTRVTRVTHASTRIEFLEHLRGGA